MRYLSMGVASAARQGAVRFRTRCAPLERRIDGIEPIIGGGMAHEAVEFQRCLAEGLLESPLVPHAQTLTIMRQMDDLRRQVGVRYQGDD